MSNMITIYGKESRREDTTHIHVFIYRQYLFFMVHLKNKDRTEYTGPESYVSECLKEANYSFFPINRALCLHQNEDDDGERLEKLEELTQSLIQKVNAMEEHIEKIAETQSRSRSNSLMLSPM